MTEVQSKSCIIRSEQDLIIANRILNHEEDKVLVQVEAGGICGSDIHYYQHGRAGASVIQEPMIIGHEFVGIVKTAPVGSTLKVGQKVAINPSQPCYQCERCRNGQLNHCRSMRFMGSAQHFPHTQGGFTQYVSVNTNQCFPYDASIASEIMAFSEPLSVAIHAVNKAGSLIGKKVLVIGSGTIGGLVIAAAKAAGAQVVLGCDVSERSCKVAIDMGADHSFSPLDHEEVTKYQQDNGYFDVTFEATGVPSAIQTTVDFTKPNGKCIQLGMGNSSIEYPISQFLVKEIEWTGSFRFKTEVAVAVNWLETKRVDPTPLISGVFSLDDAESAIIAAADKAKSTKVILKIQ